MDADLLGSKLPPEEEGVIKVRRVFGRGKLRAKKTFAINFDATGSSVDDVLCSETPLHQYCRENRQLSHEEELPVQPQRS